MRFSVIVITVQREITELPNVHTFQSWLRTPHVLFSSSETKWTYCHVMMTCIWSVLKTHFASCVLITELLRNTWHWSVQKPVTALKISLPSYSMTGVSKVTCCDSLCFCYCKQGHHHNGDQAVRRPHMMCSICGRRFTTPLTVFELFSWVQKRFRPPFQPRYDDKYSSRSYRFVERQ